jgi:hypothetical protein
MNVLEQILQTGAPCYLSFEWAMFYHGLIDQPIHRIQCATLRDGFRTEVAGFQADFFCIPEDCYFGFAEDEEPLTGEQILIALPEKSVLDYLWRARDEGYSGYLLFSVDWEKLNAGILREFAERMDPFFRGEFELLLRESSGAV